VKQDKMLKLEMTASVLCEALIAGLVKQDAVFDLELTDVQLMPTEPSYQLDKVRQSQRLMCPG
jgi:hypothetical protein